MSTKSMNKKGFTLIELLIVVVIIGILAAIAIPRFGQTRERAFISTMQSDLRQVATAQELYYQANNFEYAAAVGSLEAYYQPSENVTMVVGTQGVGWTATASMPAQTDFTCTITVDGTDSSNLTCTDGEEEIGGDDGGGTT